MGFTVFYRSVGTVIRKYDTHSTISWHIRRTAWRYTTVTHVGWWLHTCTMFFWLSFTFFLCTVYWNEWMNDPERPFKEKLWHSFRAGHYPANSETTASSDRCVSPVKPGTEASCSLQPDELPTQAVIFGRVKREGATTESRLRAAEWNKYREQKTERWLAEYMLSAISRSNMEGKIKTEGWQKEDTLICVRLHFYQIRCCSENASPIDLNVVSASGLRWWWLQGVPTKNACSMRQNENPLWRNATYRLQWLIRN